MSVKKKYKFKDLQCYLYADWLAAEKKFRTVYLEQDTDWISAALSFYNILFDEEQWSCVIRFVCEEYKGGGWSNTIYDKEQEITVNTDQDIIIHRAGWGSEAKDFWKKGTYRWRGFIDGVEVGTKVFYVEKAGLVHPESNPFLNINTIRFYESGVDDVSYGQRRYITQFKKGETRYVNTEFTFTNKLMEPWFAEVEFLYYDRKNNQLKGKDLRIKEITNSQERIDIGYGSNDARTWIEGEYELHVNFMGIRIAVVPFSVGADWLDGDPAVSTSSTSVGGAQLQSNSYGEVDEKTLDELLTDFDQLIGLNEIKSQIRNYIGYFQYEKIREDKGLSETRAIKLNAVLTGNPGTGKTTVAQKLGQIYKALGLLSRGHVHEVDRADLVAEYIGQTAPRVKEAINIARGGILFIDEAYSLYREDSPRDFGHEVIEILLKEMSDGPGDLVVLVAGYPEEMNAFINSNPGLRSRFQHYFTFPDYVPDEMMAIADLGLEKRNLKISDEARGFVFSQLTRAYRDRDRSFGNARYVMSLLDEAKMNLAMRLVAQNMLDKLSGDELSTIQLEDMKKIFSTGERKNLSFEVDSVLLQESLNELDKLIGIDNIKMEIRDLVKLVRYYHEIGKDVLNQFVLHTIFIGNPGTGKTTVARIYARIFKALGIIERGHLVECDREALVAGYSGQTSAKTAAVIEKAIGGVLFIDEAYALKIGPNDDFGTEAINTLLKRMEDRNKEFIVIAAGYPDNMKEFLESNPGLSSRFERTIQFHDYLASELMEIAEVMFSMDDLRLDEEARKELLSKLEMACAGKDKFFGNGRLVRNIVQKIVKNHSLRMANLPAEKRSVALITTISIEDLDNLPISTLDYSKRKSIGF